MAPTHKNALVYGASGITGWAIVKEILEGFPTPETFDSVTAMTNRPLTADAAYWPQSPKLQIVSGVNLLNPDQGALEAEIKQKVRGIENITHVYFFAYIQDMDGKKECQINEDLIKAAVTAVDNLSPKLEFVILPTGTKRYGVHLLEDGFPFHNDTPLKESLGRIPEPYASEMFYYAQIDMLKKLSKGKAWTWAEIIPDNINGFVPNNNIYCLAQTLGTYLSLYLEKNGKGAECPFPGTEKSWKCRFTDSFQDVCAKVSIMASLQPEQSSEQGYNTGDSVEPITWSTKWPAICDYFGLKGTPPPPGGSGPEAVAYLADHFDEWKALEKKHGLVTGRVGNDRSPGFFANFIITMLNFDRHMDMSKTKKLMGSYFEEVDSKTSWAKTFDRFRTAKIIP